MVKAELRLTPEQKRQIREDAGIAPYDATYFGYVSYVVDPFSFHIEAPWPLIPSGQRTNQHFIDFVHQYYPEQYQVMKRCMVKASKLTIKENKDA